MLKIYLKLISVKGGTVEGTGKKSSQKKCATGRPYVLLGKWTRDKKERAAPSHVIEKRERGKQLGPLWERKEENGKHAGTHTAGRETI